MRVKDEMLMALADEARSSRQQPTEVDGSARYVDASADAARAHMYDELQQWVAVAEALGDRVEQLQGELGASRQLVDQLREQNQQVREQNEQLHAHCKGLRQAIAQSVQ